jgi:glutathione synthase/RimK-type ligase-like ATP-grasp enzyme
MPVVPTRLARRGDGTPLAEHGAALGVGELVVKPAVGAASRGTLRVRPGEGERGEAHLRALSAVGDVLVQPYLPSVEGYGERSLIWIDGTVTHAVRKSPRFAGQSESVSALAVPVAPDEEELAYRAVAAAPAGALYARVDMARDEAGVPRIMELELVEPSLYFTQSEAGLARYVRAVQRELAAVA